MKPKQRTFFDSERMAADEAWKLSIESLREHGARHPHWVIAWSGGKDSTALLTFAIHAIEVGAVEPPDRLTVCYADTRMELPPLAASATLIIEKLRASGIEVEIVCAEMDKRYFVYLLGRGVPPPNNSTFRWCTRQIKVDPMQRRVEQLIETGGSEVLMLTGVRVGESAARDNRIAISCSKDGSECGQGWYQQMSGEGLATLAPILHWRVCGVWDWLKEFAPRKRFGGWPTTLLADAYGGDEAAESAARTGCNGCPLAEKDTALDGVLELPQWQYLAPLKRLRPIYRELRLPHNRLRMPYGESRKDGTLSPNQCRMGPLTMAARMWALDEVLSIQDECNRGRTDGHPPVDMLNRDEETRIRELIAANTWPNKWTGDEPVASLPYFEPTSNLQLF